MTDAPGKIIPNSFQTPNFFIDECMSYLTGNEIKCVIFLARKTFGWQKRSDRIAKPQLIAATGLNAETVDGCMTYLMEVGLVLRLHENNSQNEGIEWALQLDDQKIRFDLLKERKAKQDEAQQKRTQKAREAIASKRGGLSNNHTPQEPSVGQKTKEGRVVQQSGGGTVGQPEGGSVQQGTQKPIKAKKYMGADAPVRALPELVQERVEAFPQDCHEGARLMFSTFGLIPPEKPAPDAKGGDFALWINGIRELSKLAIEYNTPLTRAFELTHMRWNRAPFSAAHPGALKKVMASVLATDVSKRTKRAKEQSSSTPEVGSNFIPNPLPRPANLPPSKPKPQRRK